MVTQDRGGKGEKEGGWRSGGEVTGSGEDERRGATACSKVTRSRSKSGFELNGDEAEGEQVGWRSGERVKRRSGWICGLRR
jgi:hypothetical protein